MSNDSKPTVLFDGYQPSKDATRTGRSIGRDAQSGRFIETTTGPNPSQKLPKATSAVNFPRK